MREAIGVAPQETALFKDSIGNNTAYRHRGSTRDEVVAHRLSTIAGTHAGLLRRKGVYARLWLLRQRMDKDAAR